MKYLIVNADDFGASAGINRGILEAHVRGVLTSTSLMVNMPAVAEAVRSSRDYPALSIGLHVNFTNESEGPVVDLDDDEACRAELARQFEMFGDVMGCLPSHIDSHHHVHRRRNLLCQLIIDTHLNYPPYGFNGPVIIVAHHLVRPLHQHRLSVLG